MKQSTELTNNAIYIKDLNFSSIGHVKMYKTQDQVQQYIISTKLDRQYPEERLTLKHPNILQVLGQNNENLFFQYCDANLEYIIKNRIGTEKYIPENELMQLISDVIDALTFLQVNEINHGGICPQYIYFDPTDLKFKIYDIELITGRCYNFTQGVYNQKYSYLSPEQLLQIYHKNFDQVYKEQIFKSDVFSLGLCFLEASTLSKFPFSLKNNYYKEQKQIIEKISQTSRYYSYDFQELLKQMLNFDPNNRPDLFQLQKIIKFGQIRRQGLHILNQPAPEFTKQETQIHRSQSSRVFQQTDVNKSFICDKNQNKTKIYIPRRYKSTVKKVNPDRIIIKPQALIQSFKPQPQKVYINSSIFQLPVKRYNPIQSFVKPQNVLQSVQNIISNVNFKNEKGVEKNHSKFDQKKQEIDQLSLTQRNNFNQQKQEIINMKKEIQNYHQQKFNYQEIFKSKNHENKDLLKVCADYHQAQTEKQ